MSKSKSAKPAAANAAVAVTDAERTILDNAVNAATGSRKPALAACARYAVGTGAGPDLLRARLGEGWAHKVAAFNRELCKKLPRIATALAQGAPYCSFEGMKPEARNSEDASVPVALTYIMQGETRAKAILAAAVGGGRYLDAQGAQMNYARQALAAVGIVEGHGTRNADYKVTDADAAATLIPQEIQK
jgi:hypothetical protein